MAKLHRFVKLDDRFDTHVFTFLLPSSFAHRSPAPPPTLTAPSHNSSSPTPPNSGATSQDITVSRDFIYALQKWTLTAERRDQHLGVYINLDNVYDGVTVTLDVSVTLVNHEHFTRNESFAEKDYTFTSRRATLGRKSFVAVTDLAGRAAGPATDQPPPPPLQGSGGSNGHPTTSLALGTEGGTVGGGGGGVLQCAANAPPGPLLLEVEMKNCRTTFYQVFKPLCTNARDAAVLLHARYETTYFSFGCFDWSLSILPTGDVTTNQEIGRPTLQLVRQTSFDQTCRILLQVTIFRGENVVIAGETIERLVDTNGYCEPYILTGGGGGGAGGGGGNSPEGGVTMTNGAGDPTAERRIVTWMTSPSREPMSVRLDLLSCSTISRVDLFPFDRNKNRAYLYDRDKQAWMIESDVSRGHLTLRLFYADIRNVPRGHLRYVSWITSLLNPREVGGGGGEGVGARGGEKGSGGRSRITGGGPAWNYYVQQDIDEGYDIVTNISTAELNPGGSYVDVEEGGKLMIQIEWIESHLLFQDKLQKLDSISVKHKHQMRRELQLLQAENYALEKQVHSYQQSLARTGSNGAMTSMS